MKTSFFLFCLALLMYVGCQKEELPLATPELELGNLITVSLAGLILDESGNPVEGASVNFGNQSVTTDNSGVFRIEETQVSENLAQIEVTKEGYFLGSRTLQPKLGMPGLVHIQLLEKNIVGTFSGDSGGMVQLPGQEVQIDFPSKGIVDANGNLFTGEVQVAIQYLDPTKAEIFNQMPGDLLGFTNSAGMVSLASFGMVAVELSGSGGQILNMAENKEAILSIELPPSLTYQAPSSIPLWHFDKDYGIWMEEGFAVLEHGHYVGHVSHFSYWNCDEPFPLIQFNGSLHLNDESNPISDMLVKLTVLNSSVVGFGYSNMEGVFQGAIPKDELLLLEVVDNCGETIYSQQIGPFSANVTINPIILNEDDLPNNYISMINGRLIDCIGLPITEGYVTINSGAGPTVIFTDSTGAFSGLFQTCSDNDIGLVGVDIVNAIQSELQVFSAEPEITTGDIEACDISLDEFFQFTLDGEEYFSQSPTFYGTPPSDSYVIFVEDLNPGKTLSLKVEEQVSVGVFPANYLNIDLTPGSNGPLEIEIEAQNPENITVEITESGSLYTDLVRGSFEGPFLDQNGLNHYVKGQFKFFMSPY
jgi:hypothetical protein